jgi:hypothetical protein
MLHDSSHPYVAHRAQDQLHATQWEMLGHPACSPDLIPHNFLIYLNINQLDALNFIISLFHASTCFKHMCSSSGGQNCTIQPLVSSHL